MGIIQRKGSELLHIVKLVVIGIPARVQRPYQQAYRHVHAPTVSCQVWTLTGEGEVLESQTCMDSVQMGGFPEVCLHGQGFT